MCWAGPACTCRRRARGTIIRGVHCMLAASLDMATATRPRAPSPEGRNGSSCEEAVCSRCREPARDLVPLSCAHVQCTECRARTRNGECLLCDQAGKRASVSHTDHGGLAAGPPTTCNGQSSTSRAEETLPTSDDAALCEEHSLGLTLFCEDCNKLLCTICARESHNGHSYEEAAALLPDHIAALRELLEPARDLLSRAESAVRRLSQDDESIESNRQLCTDNIRETFNGLRAALDEREKLLLSTIDRYIETKLAIVRKQRSKLTEGLAQVQEAIESIGRLAERSSDVLVLHDEQLIMDELDFQQERILDMQIEMQVAMYSSTYVGFRDENVKLTTKSFDKVIALCEFFPDADSGYYCSRDIIIEGENPYSSVSNRGSASRVRFRPSFRAYTRRHSTVGRSFRRHNLSNTSIPEGQSVPSEYFRRPSLASTVSSFSSDSEDSSDECEQPPMPPIRFGSLITPSPVVEPRKVFDRLSHSRTETVFPCGVSVIMNDTLVFSDARNNCLRLLASNGKFIDTIGREGKGAGEFEDPCGIAVDGKQHILVVQKENPRVQRFTSAGKCVRRITQRSIKGNMMGEPWAVAVAPGDGSIYISDWDKGCIHVFQASGRFLHSLGLDKDSDLGQSLGLPAGLTFDPQGHLLVVDRCNHCVWVLEGDGSIHSKFGGKGHGPGDLYFPYGIAVEPLSCSVIVTETGNNRISVFSSTGEFLRSFGRRGAEPGMFDHPRHVCVNSRGELIVADEMNQRLQVFPLTAA